jgi:hypothetical protein
VQLASTSWDKQLLEERLLVGWLVKWFGLAKKRNCKIADWGPTSAGGWIIKFCPVRPGLSYAEERLHPSSFGHHQMFIFCSKDRLVNCEKSQLCPTCKIVDWGPRLQVDG